MVKCFSKKYRNKGRALDYLQSESYVEILSAPDATSLHHCTGAEVERFERFVFLFLALVCRAFCFCLSGQSF